MTEEWNLWRSRPYDAGEDDLDTLLLDVSQAGASTSDAAVATLVRRLQEPAQPDELTDRRGLDALLGIEPSTRTDGVATDGSNPRPNAVADRSTITAAGTARRLPLSARAVLAGVATAAVLGGAAAAATGHLPVPGLQNTRPADHPSAELEVPAASTGSRRSGSERDGRPAAEGPPEGQDAPGNGPTTPFPDDAAQPDPTATSAGQRSSTSPNDAPSTVDEAPESPSTGTGSSGQRNRGNPNAGGTNPNAGGTNSHAGGTNPNANPNAGGTNPNAGGANPNGGGTNPNAGGANANGGGTNPNGGGTNPNAGGNAGSANANAGNVSGTNRGGP